MSIADLFIRRPLPAAISLTSLLPVFLFSHTALGATIPVKGILDIDRLSNSNNYIVTEGGTLNVKGWNPARLGQCAELHSDNDRRILDRVRRFVVRLIVHDDRLDGQKRNDVERKPGSDRRQYAAQQHG